MESLNSSSSREMIQLIKTSDMNIAADRPTMGSSNTMSLVFIIND